MRQKMQFFSEEATWSGGAPVPAGQAKDGTSAPQPPPLRSRIPASFEAASKHPEMRHQNILRCCRLLPPASAPPVRRPRQRPLPNQRTRRTSATPLLKTPDSSTNTLTLEKAVAVTRTPRAEPISHAETRRRGEFESYAGCFMKISLHPIGEGHPF